ncbi:MAG: pyruvate formate lyase family protein [Christensenellaceae bacterium]|jgi:formate C-acetyltransferase|nr:pyruvate formate lyase family protein [Christensenellaceae bacterium]
MRNRVGTLPPGTALGYKERLAILRERKIEDTKDKAGFMSFADGDDYGAVMLPDDFRFEAIPTHKNGGYYGYEGFSKNFYKLMAQHPVLIDPCDAFAGRWMTCMTWLRQGRGFNPDYSFEHLKPLQALYGIVPGIGADSHFGGDYQIGLDLGFGGLLEKLEHFRGQNPGHDEFYDAEVLAIQGVQAWMRHTIEAIALAIEKEERPELKENLRQMLRTNEWLLFGAPRTLREACQWICWFNMASREYNRDGAGCQLDEVLRPYYERDLKNGEMSQDEAKYYIACLLLNDPHYYQLGGLSPDGRDMVGPFSYLCLEAADWLDSSCNITVRVHDKMDMDFLRKSVEYLFKNKNGWPRFSGDRALSQGFMRKGYSAELARQRVAVGCHWMSLPGLEYTLNDCVKVNALKVFRVALDEMMKAGERSTKRLWALYSGHMKKAVEVTAEGIAFHLKYQVYNQPELLLNLLSHGPVEKGLDIVNGGAEFYNMCIDGAGIASAADSFAALEQRIEREGRLGWDEVYAALQANFEGPRNDYIRAMLSASERYGGGSDSLGDLWAVRISEGFSADVVRMDEQYAPVKFIPGWFSWSNTITLGKMVAATPNGRKDFEPINHGANPHPGFRRDGALTAMSNAICSIQPGYGNTAPIQLELDPGLAQSDEAVQKICDYILTIFEQGATLLNINIINEAQILAANENPELFPDLVVRVTGFTAYFCLLTPEFRKLVVERILRAG